MVEAAEIVVVQTVEGQPVTDVTEEITTSDPEDAPLIDVLKALLEMHERQEH